MTMFFTPNAAYFEFLTGIWFCPCGPTGEDHASKYAEMCRLEAALMYAKEGSRG
jgi:hypothetical protein